MLTHVVLCVAMVISTQALGLPSYIKPCFKNRPDFRACAVKSGMDAKPSILKGDRKYRIPVMYPFVVDEMVVSTNPGPIDLKITLTNMQSWGLADAVVTDFDADFEQRVISVFVFLPNDVVTTDYVMTGKILVLPVTGNGTANMTFVGLKFISQMDYTLTTRHGKQYMVIGDVRVKLEPERAYIQFNNLFNGDKLLGDQMNAVINDNWREMLKEIGPSVADGIGAALKAIFNGVVEKIPFDVVFPDE